MFMLEQGDPFIDLAVGTMDNPNAIESFQTQIGIESRVSWFSTLHELPEAPTELTRTPEDIAKLQTRQHPDHNTKIWPPKPLTK